MQVRDTQFAIDIKVARRHSGLTQRDVAMLSSIDRTLLSKFERAKRKPSGEQLALLCVIYSKPIPELYEGSKALIYQRVAQRLHEVDHTTGPAARTETLQMLRAQLHALSNHHGH